MQKGWQDWVIGGAQWCMLLSQYPTLVHPTHKPELVTCVVMSLILGVLAITFGTLRLKASVASALALASVWCALGIQRYHLDSLLIVTDM